MSTNSAIIARYNEDTYRGIYVHWDGYPEGVGNKLVKYYTNPEKIAKLLALGSLSSLGEEIETCRDYGKGRKEKTYFIEGDGFETVVSEILETYYTLEYIYCFDIYDDKKWHFKEVLWDTERAESYIGNARWVSVDDYLSEMSDV